MYCPECQNYNAEILVMIAKDNEMKGVCIKCFMKIIINQAQHGGN